MMSFYARVENSNCEAASQSNLVRALSNLVRDSQCSQQILISSSSPKCHGHKSIYWHFVAKYSILFGHFLSTNWQDTNQRTDIFCWKSVTWWHLCPDKRWKVVKSAQLISNDGKGVSRRSWKSWFDDLRISSQDPWHRYLHHWGIQIR